MLWNTVLSDLATSGSGISRENTPKTVANAESFGLVLEAQDTEKKTILPGAPGADSTQEPKVQQIQEIAETNEKRQIAEAVERTESRRAVRAETHDFPHIQSDQALVPDLKQEDSSTPSLPTKLSISTMAENPDTGSDGRQTDAPLSDFEKETSQNVVDVETGVLQSKPSRLHTNAEPVVAAEHSHQRLRDTSNIGRAQNDITSSAKDTLRLQNSVPTNDQVGVSGHEQKKSPRIQVAQNPSAFVDRPTALFATLRATQIEKAPPSPSLPLSPETNAKPTEAPEFVSNQPPTRQLPQKVLGLSLSNDPPQFETTSRDPITTVVSQKAQAEVVRIQGAEATPIKQPDATTGQSARQIAPSRNNQPASFVPSGKLDSTSKTGTALRQTVFTGEMKPSDPTISAPHDPVRVAVPVPSESSYARAMPLDTGQKSSLLGDSHEQLTRFEPMKTEVPSARLTQAKPSPDVAGPSQETPWKPGPELVIAKTPPSPDGTSQERRGPVAEHGNLSQINRIPDASRNAVPPMLQDVAMRPSGASARNNLSTQPVADVVLTEPSQPAVTAKLHQTTGFQQNSPGIPPRDVAPRTSQLDIVKVAGATKQSRTPDSEPNRRRVTLQPGVTAPEPSRQAAPALPSFDASPVPAPGGLTLNSDSLPELAPRRWDPPAVVLKNTGTWVVQQLNEAATSAQTKAQVIPPQDVRIVNRDLGEVLMTIQAEAKSIRCHFVCAENGTDLVLRNNIETLVEELHRLGYRDVKTTFASQDSGMSPRGDSAPQQNGSQRSKSHGDAPSPDQQNQPSVRQNVPISDSMDLRI